MTGAFSLNQPTTSNSRLVADIGGTHARFALNTGQDRFSQAQSLKCADYPSLGAAIRHYLDQAQAGPIRAGVLAIATPVGGDWIRMTNHHWQFSIEATRRALGFETLLAVNDFTALAMALPYLQPHQLRPLGAQMPEGAGVKGLVGAGTGLGVSAVVPTSSGWVPLATEGGHASFAPGDDIEVEILQRARRIFGHVSAERLVSGPGLSLLDSLLSGIRGAVAVDRNPSAVIEAAQKGDAIALEAARVFTGLLGGIAGNLALTFGSMGGMYIGGGVVGRLGSLFDELLFRERFEAKGRFAAYLSVIPTFLIVADDFPALVGAARLLDAHYAPRL